MNKIAMPFFVSLAIGISIVNIIRTQEAIVSVEEFFIRARTIQAAQTAADRATVLLEDQTFQNKDLRLAFKELAIKHQRLIFEAEDVIMESNGYLQVIHAQNDYIIRLQELLQDNNLQVPSQPRIDLEPQVCPTPTPDKSAASSFNLQRPMIHMLNVQPTLLGGLCQKSLMAHDASGMVELLVA